jgi:hypothetical protein
LRHTKKGTVSIGLAVAHKPWCPAAILKGEEPCHEFRG